MPGYRYSVFNPEGESFVPEQDRLNAQLQSMAMQNMSNLANVNERAREFNIGDQTNRWNAQAEYGLGNKRLDMSAHQYDVTNAMAERRLAAEMAYQNKSLEYQHEGPAALLDFMKQDRAESAPTRALDQRYKQAQLEQLTQQQAFQKQVAAGGLKGMDPSRVALGSGMTPFQAAQYERQMLEDESAPQVEKIKQLLALNTPAAREEADALRNDLVAKGYKHAPLNPQDAKSIQQFANPQGGGDTEFSDDIEKGVDAFKTYVGKADHWLGGSNDEGSAAAFANSIKAAQERAKAAHYDPAKVNEYARQRLAQAISDKRSSMFGDRTPWNATNIDKLTEALGLGSLTGRKPGAALPIDETPGGGYSPTFGSSQADFGAY
jgi:hypothetical protein